MRIFLAALRRVEGVTDIGLDLLRERLQVPPGGAHPEYGLGLLRILSHTNIPI
jgi:hypothetical protein